MLHTSLLSHIATGSYFPQHPAGELRSQPGSEEHSTAQQRGARHGAGPEAPEPAGDPPGAAVPSRDLPRLPSTRYFQDVSWGLFS